MSHWGKGPANQQRWKEKPRPAAAEFTCAVAGAAAVAEEVGRLSIAGDASPLSHKGGRSKNRRASDVWIVRGCTTASSSTAAPVEAAGAAEVETERSGGSCPRSPKIFNDPICAAFNVDNCTFSHAQIRATFYPKFENEKSDQEIRTKMIEMVSHGLATLEVSLKHSGSLFMYASHEGGAYAKNSFRNMYTAVGVFVLSRMFLEAWGTEARKMQAEFNNFLEKNRMCISMELVTACLGDHGQRPIDDYVVVTAVTELGHGKPKFYSTPELIAFCRKWRLPTNHVWLFSTRKSATSFFAAYDALCEEGTATPVCKALNEIADISVPGSKDHVKVQGEILEGLVVRVVSPDSSKEMEDVLRSFPPPPSDGVGLDLGPSLREVCSANRSDEKQLVKSLLQHAGTSMCPNQSDWFGDEGIGERSRQADRSVVSKFLQAHPADYATMKLQEMIRLMKQRRLSAAFKCYYNLCKIDSNSSDYIHYKMVIHIHKDYVFQRYRKEMRENPELWPLYRGFFIDINLFKVNEEEAAELTNSKFLPKFMNDNNDSASIVNGGLADEDGNLMMKLKFLTYRLRTFLIRNGLRELFKDGPNNYKSYYLKQMNTWGTSAVKQEQLSKMLDEWAIYIQRKYENKRLPSLTYLSEAEPFLEHYANRTLENQALVGFAGNLIGTENILALIHGSSDEEDDLPLEEAPRRPTTSIRKDPVSKAEGLIIFFPGIPGCAKSALCKEILGNDLADDRPMNIMMGDLIKGRYWQKVAEEHRRKPYSIILADKNAPNEEVWRQVENMCRSTRASAIPVIPESEGTDSNPFSLDALAVFMFRVLQRVNHPGNLDKASPNAGYVLLMFYRLYDGKTRRDFENELCERFGSLVRIPLLKQDRKLLPEPIKVTLEEGITLFRLHSNKHGSLESSKGAYAKDWAKWEKGLHEVLFGYADHLNDIQVPFDFAAKIVLEQLKDAVNGEYKIPGTQNRKLGNIVFAAVTLPIVEIKSFLNELARKHNKIEIFLKGKDMGNNMRKAHVTLAHKRSHGVAAVASYGIFLKQNVPVHLIAFLFSKRMAAIEVKLGSVNNEKVEPKTEWPHVTLWTAPDVPPKEVGTLPSLVAKGRATRIEITPPVSMSGSLDFY